MSSIQEKKVAKPLTLEERKEIKKWISRKYTLSNIAEILERGKNTVIAEVKRNGGRDSYDQIQAHKRAECMQVERLRKTSETLKGKAINPYTTMSEKISNLEMQLEILLEEVKRLRK